MPSSSSRCRPFALGTALVLGAFALSPPAAAATLAGVTLPDTATVGGQSLVLNGLGLREKVFIDVYVGALYLPAKTTSGTSAIQDDVPKRIIMHFVYSEVTKDQIAETFEEGIAKLSNSAALKPKVTQLNGMMDDVKAGDEVVLDYSPGTGTTVTVKGKVKGTIQGVDFMRGLWEVYLGANPPTGALKKGMLGI